MANKFYQVEKEIDGVKYTAQFNGLSLVFRMADQCKISIAGELDTSAEQTVQYILDNVIVDPHGLTIDDFDEMETLNAVVKWGGEVAQGKFRDKKDQGAAKAASRK